MRKLLCGLLLFPLAACASVTSTVDKTGPFTITGLPQVIPVGFPAQQGSDLLVLDEGSSTSPRDPAAIMALGSDYTTSGFGYNTANQMQPGSISVSGTGSSVVLVNDQIVILRGVPINQTTSFGATGPLTIALLEQALDKNATLAQQVNELANRALQFENFEFPSTAPSILSRALRAGNILAFDANGNIQFLPSVTAPGASGVTKIIAGANTSISPSTGLGNVTVTAIEGITYPPHGANGELQWNSLGTNFEGTSGMTWNGTGVYNVQTVSGGAPGGAILQSLQNLSSGATSGALSVLANSTDQLAFALSSTGFSGPWLTGWPSGEAAGIYTVGSVPLVIGTNSTAAISIATSGVATFASDIVARSGSFSSGVGSPGVIATGNLTLQSGTGDPIVLFGNTTVIGTIAAGGGAGFGITAVNTVSPTSPNRTITFSYNGTTYYIACKTSDD
jgi:hypothetical protein